MTDLISEDSVGEPVDRPGTSEHGGEPYWTHVRNDGTPSTTSSSNFPPSPPTPYAGPGGWYGAPPQQPPNSPPAYSRPAPPQPQPPKRRIGLLITLVVIASVLATVLVLAFVGRSVVKKSASDKPPVTSSVPTPTHSTRPVVAPAPRPVVDPNKAACDRAHSEMVTVATTMHTWNPDTELFSSRFARQFRSYGTRLYAISASATGVTAQAIQGEAAGLTKLSVAMENQDPNAVGSASNSGNAALAELRGVCGF